jgi:WD40 repeat protein
MDSRSVVSVFEDKAAAKNQRECQINALAWSPSSPELLCTGSVAGILKIIDFKKNKVIAKITVGNQTLFEASWNMSGIAVCSENGFL